MHGPIDFIVVGFEGNKFDGSVLKAIGEAIDKGIIGLVALCLIKKDDKGLVSTFDVADTGDDYFVRYSKDLEQKPSLIDEDDVREVSELLENNTSAGLLVVEQLWAKPLKQALLKAHGVLVAEGRIHPEAAAALD